MYGLLKKRGSINLFYLLLYFVFNPANPAYAHYTGSNHLHPDPFEITLCPGACKNIYIRVDLEKPALQSDVLFAFNTVCSINSLLSELKLNAATILGDIRAMVPDTNFGVITHRDYPGCCGSICGYIGGYGGIGDWPYRLDLALTGNISDVIDEISSISCGGGADPPQSFSRVFYESYSDPDIVWRPGAKKVLMNFTDRLPHDCDVNACIGGPVLSTGLDPGRDGVEGTSDDLPLFTVLDNMLRFHIQLLTLVSNSAYYPNWKCYAEITAGNALYISDPVTSISVIHDMFLETFTNINVLELAKQPGFEDWVTDIDPPVHTSFSVSAPISRFFRVKICMPAGTSPGTYNFTIAALGDGALLAEQSVIVNYCTTPVPINKLAIIFMATCISGLIWATLMKIHN